MSTLNFTPPGSEIVTKKDQASGKVVWERAMNLSTTKAAQATFANTRKAVNLWNLGDFLNGVSSQKTFEPLNPDKVYTISVLAGEDFETSSTAWSISPRNQDGSSRGNLAYMSDYIAGQVFSRTFTGAYMIRIQTATYAGSLYVCLSEGANQPYYPYFSPEKVMPSLKVFGGIEERSTFIPADDYDLVEYIESSGTQYIDTGFKPNPTTTKCIISYEKVFNVGFVCGARYTQSSTHNKNCCIYAGPTTVRKDWISDSNTVDISSGITNITAVNQTLIVNGITYTGTHEKSADYLNANFILFGVYNEDTDEKTISSSKMYSVKLYDNDILVRDFVPVKKKSNSEYGMYDLVTKRFFANAGSGSFAGGNVITPVKYIESNGAQRIDTGIYLNGDGHKAEVEYEFDEDVSASRRTLFGAQFGQNLMTLYSGSGYACGDSTIGVTGRVTSGVYKDGHHIISFEMANDKAIYILDNGTPKEIAISASTFVNTQLATNLRVSICTNNNGGSHTQNYDGRIYKFKFWKQGKLIRNLIPVKVGTEYCMYDLVERKLYRNAGTGSFTGGTETSWRLYFPYDLVCNKGKLWYGYEDGAVIPGEYERVEYINNGATGYIVTNLYPSDTDKIYVRASTTDGLTANRAVFGNYHDGGSAKDFVGYFGKDHFYVWSNGTQQNFVAKPQTNAIYEFTVDYLNGLAIVKGDGVDETLTFTTTTFACDHKLPLGARYNSGYGGSFAYNFYSVKYYRNNELIGDFVPVKKKKNPEYGMYDLVTKQFFGNAGTGSFTGGSIIPRKLCVDGEHKVTISGKNLIDFNETRIGASTWATADKTKGFEIIADIYGKSIGNSLGTNGNCFGAFVPCRKGESVSLDFFNYAPYYGRCFYCEVDADFKVLTTPIQYSNGQSSLTQKTFTATSDNCIGFAIEWFISATQLRDYTKENYMVVRGTVVPTAYEPYVLPVSIPVNESLVHETNYIDIQTGTLHQEWAVKVFDGTEQWTKHNTYDVFVLSDSSIGVDYDLEACNSNYFYGLQPKIGAGSVHEAELKSGYAATGGGITRSWYLGNFGRTDASGLKTWLKSKYNEGDPVIAVYPLATPTNTPVSYSKIALATKGQKSLLSQSEIPTDIQATYLGAE